jgi:hypothetical protein
MIARLSKSAPLALCIAATVCAACSSTREARQNAPDSTVVLADTAVATPQTVDSELKALAPQFASSQIPGARFSLTFAVGAGGGHGAPSLAAIRRITAFTAELFDPTGGRADSLATQEINVSGTANSQDGTSSLAAFGGLEWHPHREPPPGTYAVLTLYTTIGYVRDTIYVQAMRESFRPREVLRCTLTPAVRKEGATFTLHVQRISAAPAEEYLPSAEQYRFEVLDASGTLVWSSSAGKAFAQMVGRVEPADVGAVVDHVATWNGTDARRKAAPPGTYTAVGIIPAKPNPYVVRKEFIWSGR